jgi:hypothetical protein
MPQLKRPEEAPQEKPPENKPKKNVKGPRAVGLLQLNSSGKGTLIPVAILIDGTFYDASVYKANPVPMALDGGTVYEVEKTGESQGLFTIRGALHNQNPESQTPWLGAGSYVLNGTEVASTAHKAEDKPRGLDNDNDAPPRLTRGKETGTASDGKPAPSSASGGGASQTEATAKPGTSGDSDKSGTGNSQTPNAAGQGASPQSSKGSSSTHDSAAQDGSPQSSAGHGQTANGQEQTYYRPTLRRGKPTQSAPEEAADDAALATDKLTSATVAGATAGAPPQPAVQLVPAISDGGGPQPESYKFFWKEGEEEDRRKQMLALAADEVSSYVRAREKLTITATPAVTKTSAAKAKATDHKSEKTDPVLENIQFRAFDVWKNNQPVMILTAEAHLPPKPQTSTPSLTYNVTIAARTDIYGDLRKLYSGVTDKFHLDVTPRLNLIDVVDADGDGRGELLFHETTDAGNGYVIYRATGDTLWKMFDSLSQK